MKLADKSKKSNFFEITVKWYNRPVSLSDPEYAILSLKSIEEESKVQAPEGSSSEYRKALTEHWRKSDPTPGTMFNPLMDENASRRIDYAAKNFSSLKRE